MTAPATQPATLADWFAAELEQKLATIPEDGERFYFLSRQYKVWNQRRTRFFDTGGKSEAHSAHPQFGLLTATDFLLILGIISRAKDRVVQKESA